jgi:MFS family permease
MRLLTASIFRKVPPVKMIFISLGIMLTATIILQFSASYYLAVTALILLGAGLAGGFPIMLGIVGSRYADQSATAFSFVFVIALAGNMLLNYTMGLIANAYGIQYMTAVIFTLFITMFILGSYVSTKNRTASVDK